MPLDKFIDGLFAFLLLGTGILFGMWIIASQEGKEDA